MIIDRWNKNHSNISEIHGCEELISRAQFRPIKEITIAEYKSQKLNIFIKLLYGMSLNVVYSAEGLMTDRVRP